MSLKSFIFVWYFSILSIRPRIFNISIDSFRLDIFSSLVRHILQLMEKTNISLKISDILRVYHFRIRRNTIYIFHLNFLEFIYILPVSFESLEMLYY